MSREYPATSAPNSSSHVHSQEPLNPVWPVTSTRRPAYTFENISDGSSGAQTIVAQCSPGTVLQEPCTATRQERSGIHVAGRVFCCVCATALGFRPARARTCLHPLVRSCARRPRRSRCRHACCDPTGGTGIVPDLHSPDGKTREHC